VQRLTELIESVLRFSQIERGRLAPKMKQFDLDKLVRTLFEEIQPVARKKGLNLKLSVAPALPPLQSDPDMVRLIVTNLVTNAVKFPDHGVVEVSLGIDCNAHRISVKDNGRGIPAEAQARVFEPFEQLEGGRQKHQPGVGLGLAIVRKMTVSLGGTVRLESVP